MQDKIEALLQRQRDCFLFYDAEVGEVHTRDLRLVRSAIKGKPYRDWNWPKIKAAEWAEMDGWASIFVPIERAAAAVKDELGLDLYELLLHSNAGDEVHNFLGGLHHDEMWLSLVGEHEDVWIDDARVQRIFRWAGIEQKDKARLPIFHLGPKGHRRYAYTKSYSIAAIENHEWCDAAFSLEIEGGGGENPFYYFGEDRARWPERLREMTRKLLEESPDWIGCGGGF